jgi:uncharacterized protein
VSSLPPALPVRDVIMQPTTLCNWDCKYCYLPDRHHRKVMWPLVARSVAKSLIPLAERRPIGICWHGGEPLTIGVQYFRELVSKFSTLDVVHSIQTNASLVDGEWCDFFAEHRFRVGVSLDGFGEDNHQRVDRVGRETSDKAIRGIQRLVTHGFPVSLIAVVSDPSADRASRLYAAATELGCVWLGVNIEETEGVNERGSQIPHEQVVAFWKELVRMWQRNPVLHLRDANRALKYAADLLQTGHVSAPSIDPLPTVAWNGEVTLISPELAGFSSQRWGSFSCGNVLRTDLTKLTASGMNADWVREYRKGVATCEASCRYFNFCGGGHPANRYFEHGRLDGTETEYCRNSKQALMEGVISLVDDNSSRRPDNAA